MDEGPPHSSVHPSLHKVSDCSSTPKHLLYEDSLINTTLTNSVMNSNNDNNNRLLLAISTQPTREGKQGMWRVPSPKEIHLLGPRRAFSGVAHSLWNIIPAKIRFLPPPPPLWHSFHKVAYLINCCRQGVGVIAFYSFILDFYLCEPPGVTDNMLGNHITFLNKIKIDFLDSPINPCGSIYDHLRRLWHRPYFLLL